MMRKSMKLLFVITITVLFLVSISCVSATTHKTDKNTNSTVNKVNTKNMDLTKPVKNHVKNKETQKINKKNKTLNKESRKINKKSNKIKKEDSNLDKLDLYVSDETGRDTNNGSKNSPFKTVQKALDKTEYETINNIHIKNGLYQGAGNTNLSIDGMKYINFIGENRDDTIFHGQAKYIINMTQFGWGASDLWSYYDKESGNWFMNVTHGYGKITLQNLTVTRMYNIGAPGTYWRGDSINLYPTATVDNYGTLEVNNVYFNQNFGGVGAAIRNNPKAKLTVNNSEFTKNQKSSSSGNEGIIYNKGTATVLNSNFHDNIARWGTILNDKEMTVINTTFKDNIGYDGASEFKYGSGYAFNSGSSDYFDEYALLTNNTLINCTFINCNLSSIWGEQGNLICTGSKFINTTGIRLLDNNDGNREYIIENNTFNNIIGSYIDKTLSNRQPTYFVMDLKNLKGNIVKINNNTINTIKGTIISACSGNITNNNIIVSEASDGIIISDSADNTTKIIENNTINANITLVTNNTIVQNNKVTTTNEYAIYLRNNNGRYMYGNNIIINNYLVSSNKLGDNAVTPNENNTIKNNTPNIQGDIVYCSPDAQPDLGTLNNPTTIYDALSKVLENGTILLLPGTTNKYNLTTTLNINKNTVKDGTTTFSIMCLDPTTKILSNKTIFNISNEYNITLNSITLSDFKQQIIINNGELTLIESKITNNLHPGNLIINNGNMNFIDCELSNNKLTTEYASIPTIHSTGYINIIGNNIIKMNRFGRAFINGGELILKGNNTIENQKPYFTQDAILFGGDKAIINGTNNFNNNDYNIIWATETIIVGQNTFKHHGYNYGSHESMFTFTNATISGENIFEDVKYPLFTMNNNANVLINGSNIFRNIGQTVLFGQYQYHTDTNLTINGSNIFENNHGIIEGSMNVNIFGSNIFNNNNGTIISLYGNTLNITGENKFTNNNATNGVIYLPQLYMNNQQINNTKIYIIGNMFINNTAEKGGIIYILNTTKTISRVDNEGNIYSEDIARLSPKTIIIVNNTFINTKSDNETLNVPCNESTIKIIENNTYQNCTIQLSNFIINSPQEQQTIIQNAPILINIESELLHPEYYDNNIQDKISYAIVVNNNGKHISTGNTATIHELYYKETGGVLTIFANLPENINSNSITVNIQRPLDTQINITIPGDVTINKETPLTIMLTDENGNLAKNVQITLNSNTINETITLNNGATVYTYTPNNLGIESITITYNGNDTLAPTNKTINITVTDKKATIEQLNQNINDNNNTIQELQENITQTSKNIEEKNKEITQQQNTINNLNNTVETQKQNIQKLEETVEKTTTKTKTTITIGTVTTNIGKTVTIKATVKDANGKAVTGGKVSLKVNGVVLKDSSDNTVYADVNKGIATINYVVPASWMKKGLKVEAFYTEDSKYQNSNKTTTDTIKVNKGTSKITLTPNIKTLKAGQKVTINVKQVDSNTKQGLTSTVTVKVNGKTYKVKVKNGEGKVTYTVPKGTDAKTIKVTATHSDNYYNKATGKTSFKVTKTTPTIKTTKTTYKSKKTTIKGKILDANNKVLTKNVKVTVKVDGKVVLKNKVVKKGKINLSFKKSLKKGYHELVITSKATKAFNKASFTGVLKV